MTVTNTRRSLAFGGAFAALAAALASTARPTVADAAPAAETLPEFTDHYATNGGVKIHYVTAGNPKGPMVLMVHGYPDFWYGWRHLMAVLGPDYHVVAMDQRGYNLSDKPEGVANYDRAFLIGDIAAVIAAEGRKSTILVGHDWGASTSWRVATDRPDLVDRLVILSIPHPTRMAEALRDNPKQQQASQYARNFQKPGAEANMTPQSAANWVKDEAAKPKYIEAFGRSNFTSMLNYYRANYPSDFGPTVKVPTYGPVKAPVLILHGLKDTALISDDQNGVWHLVTQDTTLLMLPDAGHWIEQDAGPLANRTIKDWLAARPVKAAGQRV
jgi:pimeloyl-ACP methyl ester carboxylesterase